MKAMNYLLQCHDLGGKSADCGYGGPLAKTTPACQDIVKQILEDQRRRLSCYTISWIPCPMLTKSRFATCKGFDCGDNTLKMPCSPLPCRYHGRYGPEGQLCGWQGAEQARRAEGATSTRTGSSARKRWWPSARRSTASSGHHRCLRRSCWCWSPSPLRSSMRCIRRSEARVKSAKLAAAKAASQKIADEVEQPSLQQVI